MLDRQGAVAQRPHPDMDEPTSAISEQESQKLFDLIRRLAGRAWNHLHHPPHAGGVRHRGPADRAKGRPLIGTLSARETTRTRSLHDGGPRGAGHVPQGRIVPGAEVLRVEKLCLKGQGLRRSLKDISLRCTRARCWSSRGSGSGRSELFESIFGLHPRDVTGDIYVEVRRARSLARGRHRHGHLLCHRRPQGKGWCCPGPSARTCRCRC
jgi:ABC-type sugar transport system ATPase subunit